MSAERLTENFELPRDDLVRSVSPELAHVEIRDDSNGSGMPTLTGHFAVFDTWTEIKSSWEGNFLERIAPGAFAKTIQENASQMRVLFDHGQDPSIGNKILGTPSRVSEDSRGAHYEVPLLDTSYNRDLLPGLEAGGYGASFRFRVTRENLVQDPERSDFNPNGLPERTITEAQVMEFGPVCFPAYPGATAGIRSLTDEYRRGELGVRESTATGEEPAPVEIEPAEVPDSEPASDPDPVEEPDATGADAQATEPEPVEETKSAAPSHPESSAPGHPAQPSKPQSEDRTMPSIEEMLERIDEIKREHEEIAAQNRGNILDPETQTRWDSLVTEKDDLTGRVKADTERQEYLRAQREGDKAVEAGVAPFVNITRPPKDKAPDNVFALDEYHGRASSQEQLMRIYTDGAKRAVETMDFPDPHTDEAKAKDNLGRVMNADTPDREVARRVLQNGSPTYRHAFIKYAAGAQLNGDEQRTLGIATQGGQMPIPIQIDPTVTLTSNGVINPLRQIATIKTVTGYEWRGVVTSGVTSSYVAEGAVSTDGSPTLVQPTIDVEEARCFVPFTYAEGQDWAGLEGELGSAIADSKDVLEATAFLTGAGHASSLPRGVLRACATVIGTALNTNAGTVFAIQHVYELETALPPRFRDGNAAFVMNKAVVQRIRQFDTAGGAGLWTSGASPGMAPLQFGMPNQLLGYPVYELSTMSTAIPSSSGASWALFGDWTQFVIADRIGMSIEVIPQLFSGNTAGGLVYPTGQRGLFAYWRNSSDVLTSNAFRAGTQS